MEFATLAKLRKHHAGWKLLSADAGPAIASFLHRAFVKPNARAIREADLVEALEDHMLLLRDLHGVELRRDARQYLEEWTSGDHAYLRKYYPADGDEPEFDLTPAAERALEWLESLAQRPFVGTESRLLTILMLLREIVSATEASPQARIEELERRKAELEQEIERLRTGGYVPFNPTQVKERFLQVEETARRLLSDFRQVEENFRVLDRATRERIATSPGSKGEVLDKVFGEQDSIASSDQGRSFQAFWSFIMSPDRQEELAELVARTWRLEEVQGLGSDDLLPRIQFHLLDAGDKVQRTRATLVEQLRRYLDEKVWLENKRIVAIIRQLEQQAIAVAQNPPPDKDLAWLDDLSPTLALPFARSLAVPAEKPRFDGQAIALGDAEFGIDALFAQQHVDIARLRERVRTVLRERAQVSLAELLERFPPTQGLAEIVAYWHMATGDQAAMIDETARQRIELADGAEHRVLSLPLIVFVRGGVSAEVRP